MFAPALVSRWREYADELSEYGYNGEPFRQCAAELELEYRRWLYEEIPAKEAARLRDVSLSTVYKWKRGGMSLTRASLLGLETEGTPGVQRSTDDPLDRTRKPGTVQDMTKDIIAFRAGY